MNKITNEERIRYLEIIQNIIDRMARCSFHLKEWTIAVESALLALFASIKRPMVLLIGIIPALLFWILDSYYLQQERGFRNLYNANININKPINLYEIKPIVQDKICEVMFSKTEWPLYLVAIILLSLGVTICICLGWGW